jgi:hypothetical protein
MAACPRLSFSLHKLRRPAAGKMSIRACARNEWLLANQGERGDARRFMVAT